MSILYRMGIFRILSVRVILEDLCIPPPSYEPLLACELLSVIRLMDELCMAEAVLFMKRVLLWLLLLLLMLPWDTVMFMSVDVTF